MESDQTSQSAGTGQPSEQPNTSSTPASPTPVSPATPEMPPIQPISGSDMRKKSGRKKLGRVGIIAIAAAVLLGGSAAAYFGIIVPNKPENILRAASINMLDETKFKFDSTVSTESSGGGLNNLEGTISGQVDLDKNNLETKLGFNILGIKPTIEVRKVDRSLFFNVGDLSQFSSFAGASNPQIGSMVEQLDKQIGNRWIEIDESLVKQFKPGAECLLDFPKPFTEEDKEFLVKQYQGSDYLKVKSVSDDTLDGRDAFKFEIDFNQQDLESANKLVKSYIENISSVRDFVGCVEDITGEKLNLDEIENEQPANLEQKIESYHIWVDKASKTISKMEIATTVTQGSTEQTSKIEMNFDYGDVAIEKPGDSKPLLQVMSELQQLFQSGSGSGGGSGSFLPISNFL